MTESYQERLPVLPADKWGEPIKSAGFVGERYRSQFPLESSISVPSFHDQLGRDIGRNNSKGEPTVAEVRSWLLTKHTTLWGESFILVKEGTNRAAEWFVDTMKDFERWREVNDS